MHTKCTLLGQCMIWGVDLERKEIYSVDSGTHHEFLALVEDEWLPEPFRIFTGKEPPSSHCRLPTFYSDCLFVLKILS